MGSELIIDEDIPGFTSRVKLEILAKHAKQVPKNGWIIEAGSFCGRSAYVLAKNADPTVTVTCIDIWPFEDKTRILEGNYNVWGKKSQFYSQETFMENTKDCPNIEAIKKPSPYFHPRFETQKADLVFIDADHSKEAVDLDLNFYYNMLNNGGIIIVDDFRHYKYPGLTQSVFEFVSNNNIKMEVLKETGKIQQFIKFKRT